MRRPVSAESLVLPSVGCLGDRNSTAFDAWQLAGGWCVLLQARRSWRRSSPTACPRASCPWPRCRCRAVRDTRFPCPGPTCPPPPLHCPLPRGPFTASLSAACAVRASLPVPTQSHPPPPPAAHASMRLPSAECGCVAGWSVGVIVVTTPFRTHVHVWHCRATFWRTAPVHSRQSQWRLCCWRTHRTRVNLGRGACATGVTCP